MADITTSTKTRQRPTNCASSRLEPICLCAEFGQPWDPGSRYLPVCTSYSPYGVNDVTQCRECTHEKECHQ